MANASTHRIGAALGVGSISLAYELQRGDQANLGRPLMATALATLTASLPDVFEPAINPHHRQFFHSVVFALMLGYGMYRLYQWQPQKDWKKVAKFGALTIGGAYLIHLAMDAGTPRSLPLV
ncbi:MAG: metal-dependent hydrolase [Gammaproteobacteria bacterium]